ncbi:hypothetical protein [Deinococcus carri]|uniref:hypothetical protein n=1 Tax=Deinococcus carri TaxID=1211323 RepID=UPI0031F15714
MLKREKAAPERSKVERQQDGEEWENDQASVKDRFLLFQRASWAGNRPSYFHTF